MQSYRCVSLLVFWFFLQVSCKRAEQKYSEASELVSTLLKQESEMMFKSEINRVRIDYSENYGLLSFHFWKMEKFDENGTLFLHLYPKDSLFLPKNRRKHGFLNFNLAKNNMVTYDEKNHFIVLKLAEIDWKEIQTGQYRGKRRNWSAKQVLNGTTPKNFKRTNQVDTLLHNPYVSLTTSKKDIEANEALKNDLIKTLFQLKAKRSHNTSMGSCYLLRDEGKSYFMFQFKGPFPGNNEVIVRTSDGRNVQQSISYTDNKSVVVYEFNVNNNEIIEIKVKDQKIQFK